MLAGVSTSAARRGHQRPRRGDGHGAAAPRLGAATVIGRRHRDLHAEPERQRHRQHHLHGDGGRHRRRTRRVVAINITPVNDMPVAGNVTAARCVGKANMLNLLADATDPDGNSDVKERRDHQLAGAARPAADAGQRRDQLHADRTGNFNITFQVKDAAGALSPQHGHGRGGGDRGRDGQLHEEPVHQGAPAAGRSAEPTRCAKARPSPSCTPTATLKTGASCNGTATNPVVRDRHGRGRRHRGLAVRPPVRRGQGDRSHGREHLVLAAEEHPVLFQLAGTWAAPPISASS